MKVPRLHSYHISLSCTVLITNYNLKTSNTSDSTSDAFSNYPLDILTLLLKLLSLLSMHLPPLDRLQILCTGGGCKRKAAFKVLDTVLKIKKPNPLVQTCTTTKKPQIPPNKQTNKTPGKNNLLLLF